MFRFSEFRLEPQIPSINKERRDLCGTKDDVAYVNRINEDDDGARDREIPKGKRHYDALVFFAHDPLHDEAQKEYELPEEADDDPRVEECSEKQMKGIGRHYDMRCKRLSFNFA